MAELLKQLEQVNFSRGKFLQRFDVARMRDERQKELLERIADATSTIQNFEATIKAITPDHPKYEILCKDLNILIEIRASFQRSYDEEITEATEIADPYAQQERLLDSIRDANEVIEYIQCINRHTDQNVPEYTKQLKELDEWTGIRDWTQQEYNRIEKILEKESPEGTLSNEGLLLFLPHDLGSLKIHDNVHGSIYIAPIFKKFIDTEQFQRLRDLKQLGVAQMVYPGAVHSRFEHSLGVYWLANAAINKLKSHQGMELGIDHFDVQTVKLAGLLHDIGHGPFGHLFERKFLPQVSSGLEWSHDQMSVDMFDHIVDEHHIDIGSGTIKRVKEMILASSKFASKNSSREKRFLYDIVANGRNGIDVNKFDYIVRDSQACGLGCNFQFQGLLETMRVLGDEICYQAKDAVTIHKLFATRADLHRTVYTDAKVKAIELMVVDALLKANHSLQIASRIEQPSQYWKLNDTILNTIETAPNPELKESRDLILRIRRRDLYQLCNEYNVPRDKIEHFKDVTAHDIVCSKKSGSDRLNEEDVAVSNVRIDLTPGRHSPFESIHFFKDYESEEKYPFPDQQISHLTPISSQDMIVRVYSKKPNQVRIISEAFENFQWKTYGIKAHPRRNPLLE